MSFNVIEMNAFSACLACQPESRSNVGRFPGTINQELVTHVLRGLQTDLLFEADRLLDIFHFFTDGIPPLTGAFDERHLEGLGAADSKWHSAVTSAACQGSDANASARGHRGGAIFLIAAYARNTGARGLFDAPYALWRSRSLKNISKTPGSA